MVRPLSDNGHARSAAASACKGAAHCGNGASLFLIFINVLTVFAYWLSNGRELFDLVRVSPNHVVWKLLAAELLGLQLPIAGSVALIVWATGRWLSTRLGTGLLIAGVTLNLSYFVVDLKLYRMLGVHLDSDIVVSTLRSEQINHELHVGGSTALSAIGILTVVVTAEWALLTVCRRLGRRLPPLRRWVWISFGLLGAVTLVADLQAIRYLHTQIHRRTAAAFDVLPLYRTFFDTSKRRAAPIRLQYPKPHLPSPRLAKRNILYVLVESLRADVATPELMPGLHAFANSHPCMTSRHHYASSHVTERGAFSFLFGLHSVYYSHLSSRGASSWPLTTLHDNGYRLIGGSASPLANWNHGAFLVRQFDSYREFADHGDYRDDAELVDWIKREVASRPKDSPFFAFVFFHSTHHNYVYPPNLERYTPVMAPDYDHFIGDDILEKNRGELFNRYKNSVVYVDQMFSDLAHAVDADVVVLTGDHGEEFWDEGLLGHSAPRLIKSRTEVPLLLCGDRMKGVTVPISGHVDILPTVFDMLHPRPPVDMELRFSGQSLLRAPPDHYALVAASGFPEDDREICVVTPQDKLSLERKGDSVSTFDLTKVTDLDDRDLGDPAGHSARLDKYAPRLTADIDRFLK